MSYPVELLSLYNLDIKRNIQKIIFLKNWLRKDVVGNIIYIILIQDF